jgi:hypothetical protein
MEKIKMKVIIIIVTLITLSGCISDREVIDTYHKSSATPCGVCGKKVRK